MILTGIDIVYIPEFERNLNLSKKNFLDRVFTKKEIGQNKKIESLAGIFAAKEAVVKALGLKPSQWKEIKIVKKVHKPKVILTKKLNVKLKSCDISISHSENYAVAFFVAIT